MVGVASGFVLSGCCNLGGQGKRLQFSAASIIAARCSDPKPYLEDPKHHKIP